MKNKSTSMREGGDSAEAVSSRTAATVESHSQYTPGPWTWFIRSETTHGGMSMKYLKGSDGQGFAHTVGLTEPCDTANAHLIAAAPELLATLKAVVHMLRVEARGTDLNNRKYDALGAQAYAAIAKAEGR